MVTEKSVQRSTNDSEWEKPEHRARPFHWLMKVSPEEIRLGRTAGDYGHPNEPVCVKEMQGKGEN